DLGAGHGRYAPPAIAGITITVAPSRSGVSRPAPSRTSSLSTNTFTKRFRSPPSSTIWARVAGCLSNWSSSAARSVSPWAATVRAPPALASMTGGRRSVVISLGLGFAVGADSAQGPRGRQAELLVVDVLDRARVLAADRALRVAAQGDLVEGRVERVEEHQPAGERLADPQQVLEGLGGLQRAHDPRQHAEHAALGARRRELRRRR